MTACLTELESIVIMLFYVIDASRVFVFVMLRVVVVHPNNVSQVLPLFFSGAATG